MNTEQAATAITENLSLITLKKVLRHLEKIGELEPDLTRAERVIKNRFGVILDNHFNNAVNPGDVVFSEMASRFFPVQNEPLTREQEEQRAELYTIYGEGFIRGYIAAAADMEQLLNALNSPEETDTTVF